MHVDDSGDLLCFAKQLITLTGGSFWVIQRAQVLTVFLQRFIQGLPSFADLLRLASLAFFLDQQRDHANASSKAMAQEEEEDPGCCAIASYAAEAAVQQGADPQAAATHRLSSPQCLLHAFSTRRRIWRTYV